MQYTSDCKNLTTSILNVGSDVNFSSKLTKPSIVLVGIDISYFSLKSSAVYTPSWLNFVYWLLITIKRKFSIISFSKILFSFSTKLTFEIKFLTRSQNS